MVGKRPAGWAGWLLSALVLAWGGPARAELRGLWVVRTALVTPAEVDRVVDRAAAAGFSALFVQVRGRGDAFYNSKRVLRSPLLSGQPADFDPLARLIERARGRGLAVHAWFNALIAANFNGPPPAGHVLAEHPDWAMVPRSAAAAAARVPRTGLLWLIRKHAQRGEAEGYFLSPAVPEVRAHLEQAVRELARSYPIDGLHLDFIRYPGREYDHSPAALEAFARSRDLDSAGPGGRGSAAADGPAWAAFQRETLGGLVAELARAAREERPQLLLSAAVVPDEAVALTQKYQDWPAWLARGALDAVCPMAYTADTRVFRRHVRQALATAGPRPVWAGIGAYKLDLSGIAEQLQAARAEGAAGVLVFSHESLAAGDWARLRPALLATGGGAEPAGWGPQ